MKAVRFGEELSIINSGLPPDKVRKMQRAWLLAGALWRTRGHARDLRATLFCLRPRAKPVTPFSQEKTHAAQQFP
jgi:hypothetical protein